MNLFSEFETLLENDVQPRYVAVKPDAATVHRIKTIVKNYKVPNPISGAKLHTTLIYSRTPTKEAKLQPHLVFTARFDKFDVFESRGGERCLVMKLESQDLQARHKQLMNELGASYDYPTYLPHITLSYDIGKFDIQAISNAWLGGIKLSNEYAEVLNDLVD